MNRFAQEINKGIALLNKHQPDWRRFVVPEKFDIRNPSSCVLGQVFGNYHIGIGFEKCMMRLDEAPHYGFTAPYTKLDDEQDDERINSDFEELQINSDFEELQKGWLETFQSGTTLITEDITPVQTNTHA